MLKLELYPFVCAWHCEQWRLLILQADFHGGHKFCSEKIRNCDPELSLTSKSLTFICGARASQVTLHAKVAAVKYHTSTSYQQLKSQITCEQVPHDVISPHSPAALEPQIKSEQQKAWDEKQNSRYGGPAIDLRCARERSWDAALMHKVLQRTQSHQRPGRIPQTTDNSRPTMNFTPLLWESQNRLSDQVTRRQKYLWSIKQKVLWAKITVFNWKFSGN